MNFLLRQSPSAAAAPPTPPPAISSAADQLPPVSPWLKKTPSQTVTTLEGLIAEDKSQHSVDHSSTPSNRDSLGGGENGSMSSASIKDYAPLVDKHVDVVEDEGWITIPFKKLPDDWSAAPDIHSFQPLDRSFVFPGEQVHILACLSASKQDTEIITPFKVAAVMNKNGYAQGSKDQNGNIVEQESPTGAKSVELDDNVDAKNINKHQVDVSASESYLRLENHRRQVQTLLQRFKDSHFFVRIDESGELLWSDRSTAEAPETVDDSSSIDNNKTASSRTSISAVIDSGRFDARGSGGVARNSVQCCSLANGDIVVLLQVNVGVDSLRNPILEILQFEKHNDGTTALESDLPVKEEHSTCGELLKWLLPLDNSQLPVHRPSSPPLLNSSHKTSFSASSGGSQLFSFGHFRSYSMSSLPQNTAPSAAPAVSATSSKPNFDLEDWNHFGSQKSLKSPRSGSQGLLSFRGVPLEPERFSVCCGLEGIYIPGRRWRKQLEIIQPVDIHSFAANCNTDDLLCVQIKNICPAHVPDIVVYIDAITIILEEATQEAGPPLSVPIACIEAGTNHSLPSLALRRGEEHSFILKPAISVLKKSKIPDDKITKLHSKAGSKSTSVRLPSVAEETKDVSTSHKYAILVSCRCNYSESRLFFKKPTDWRPRISRDFMISVASEISNHTLDFSGKVSQLPVQALTLQASNLTSEDLTLIILAPASLTPPPSVLSLNSTPSSPKSPFNGFSTAQRLSTLTRSTENQIQSGAQSLSSDQKADPVADVIPTTALGCTHLWLHSRVPLGCVPSQSTAKIKLELLPLTDGIITLDTLQIYVKEKDLTFIPENALKINATSSIAIGII